MRPLNGQRPRHAPRDPQPEPEDTSHPTQSSPGAPQARPIADTPALAGSSAGNRIIQKIGEGGMGVVYEAEQRNTKRPVALKVIRGGSYVAEQHIRLFQHETETLARLRHPAIAVLYEAGRTPAGQHFFVMELVRGEPLKKYVRQRAVEDLLPHSKDDIEWRLDLFVQICHGISYAHRRGVIHRDLKPSNILVATGVETARGSSSDQSRTAVKILDFGLARMVDADDSITLQMSEAGQIKGTLAYMSPEQARGNSDAIDIRTDIYALGVILYELLTGKLPYQVNRTLLAEAVRIICEQEPRKPGAFHKLLRGDLETMLLKALDKDPDRRYQSVEVFIEDIERYLSNQPILARPPSARYQLKKLIARHKVGFVFAITVFVLMTGFAATVTWMWQVARHERLRADAERERVQRINQDLRDLVAPSSNDTPADPAGAAAPAGAETARVPDTPASEEPDEPPPARVTVTVDEPEKVAAEALAGVPVRRPVPAPAASRQVPQRSSAGRVDSADLQASGVAEPPEAEGVPPEVIRALTRSPAGPRPGAEFTDQEIFAAASGVHAAGIQILLGEYAEAEALLLRSYPVIMEATVSEREKRDLVERLIALYVAWEKRSKAAEFRAVLDRLRAQDE
ncbi:MAG: serine/threonine protein kinase [Candidatus Krumholzibacteriia bacterium]